MDRQTNRKTDSHKYKEKIPAIYLSACAGYILHTEDLFILKVKNKFKTKRKSRSSFINFWKIHTWWHFLYVQRQLHNSWSLVLCTQSPCVYTLPCFHLPVSAWLDHSSFPQSGVTGHKTLHCTVHSNIHPYMHAHMCSDIHTHVQGKNNSIHCEKSYMKELCWENLHLVLLVCTKSKCKPSKTV